jgi:hypothetical protein
LLFDILEVDNLLFDILEVDNLLFGILEVQNLLFDILEVENLFRHYFFPHITRHFNPCLLFYTYVWGILLQFFLCPLSIKLINLQNQWVSSHQAHSTGCLKTRVTKWVCEKIAQKVTKPIFRQYYLNFEKVA